MKDWIRDYFTFNRKEQRGIAILLGIMILSVLLGNYGPFLRKEKDYDLSGFKAQVEAWMKDTAGPLQDDRHKSYATGNKSSEPAGPGIAHFLEDPFQFDPNQLDEARWNRVGLDGKIIRNILRYREKGGVFRKKEDLGKIYGMTEEIYKALEPYLMIEEENSAPDPAKIKDVNLPVIKKEEVKAEEIIPVIELNAADSAQLTLLPGIGPSFASRIVKYRNLLGGFARTDQLLEVRGMDSARFAGMADRLTIDSTLVRRINLNAVTFKEMLRHPYFEYYLVKAIFSVRDKIGVFDSVAQIRQMDIMYPELFDKISPYLEVKPIKGD